MNVIYERQMKLLEAVQAEIQRISRNNGPVGLVARASDPPRFSRATVT